MAYDPNNRKHIRERNGMSSGMFAALAIAGFLAIGGLIYAFSNDDNHSTASNARTEQTVPPATTGQGGAQSKIPQRDAR